MWEQPSARCSWYRSSSHRSRLMSKRSARRSSRARSALASARSRSIAAASHSALFELKDRAFRDIDGSFESACRYMDGSSGSESESASQPCTWAVCVVTGVCVRCACCPNTKDTFPRDKPLAHRRCFEHDGCSSLSSLPEGDSFTASWVLRRRSPGILVLGK